MEREALFELLPATPPLTPEYRGESFLFSNLFVSSTRRPYPAIIFSQGPPSFSVGRSGRPL